jgi:hypothetical protein
VHEIGENIKTDLNPQAKEMADESIVRGLDRGLRLGIL